METPTIPVQVKPSAGLPRELTDSTSFLLKRLGWACKDRSYAAFSEAGMHPMHYGILSLLDEGSRETQATIADALGYDRSQLVSLLDELEEMKFVERRRDPDDRRRHLVSMTPAGKTALKRLRALSLGLDEDLLAPLDANERATLHALLTKLASAHSKI